MLDHNTTLGYFPSIPWIPYYASPRDWSVALLTCESSGVRQLAEQGLLDITPMSTMDWFDLSDKWGRLNNWGIAFRGRAGSVLLFSNEPIEELHQADIAICDETTTSVRVLQALLKDKYGLGIGRWRRNVDIQDARTPRLLIQNQAVEELNRKRFRYVYDLGREWWDWQGTPIVPAVWVYRTGLDPALVSAAHELLEASVARYRKDPVGAILAHKGDHGWAAGVQDVVQLHKNFEYALSDESLRGIDRMRAALPREVEGFTAR